MVFILMYVWEIVIENSFEYFCLFTKKYSEVLLTLTIYNLCTEKQVLAYSIVF